MARRWRSTEEAPTPQSTLDSCITSPFARDLVSTPRRVSYLFRASLRTSTLWHNLLFYGPLLALFAWLLWLAARHGGSPVFHAPALQAVPSGPLLLVTADLRRSRGPALQALLGRDGLPSTSELRAACGEDPLAGATEVALAMPAASADGEFGVVVAGPLRVAPLIGCVERVIRARGGRPVVLREGAFAVVTDVASGSEGVVAASEGGPLLVGGLSYVRRMMATSVGREPSVEADARHVALRAEAGEGALVVSALLSTDLRERLQKGLGEGHSALAGVLGLGLSLGAADPAPLRLVVGCASEVACSSTEAMLLRLRSEEGEGAPWLPGLRTAFASAEISRDGLTVRVRMQLPTSLLSTVGQGLRDALGKP
ncbi:MAG: hypothetical protein RMJ98_05330 [Myxococcales bacterium]|nr:hypothetical protein [Polyangiaceae bacterium]MDW8248712.1 hypothetical protein [Myxococcales bacterium]